MPLQRNGGGGASLPVCLPDFLYHPPTKMAPQTSGLLFSPFGLGPFWAKHKKTSPGRLPVECAHRGFAVFGGRFKATVSPRERRR